MEINRIHKQLGKLGRTPFRQKSRAAANMALAKAGVQSELQPFVLLINFGAVRQ